jgi:peptide/nickel transport system permease protein
MRHVGRVAFRRIPRLIATMFAVSALAFGLITLIPGDPALVLLGVNDLTPDAIAEVHHKLGLDLPLPVRYANWLAQIAQGDLGFSYHLNQDVTSAVARRLPVSLELMILALTLSLAMAIPLGVFAAYRAGRAPDRVISAVTFGILSVPGFVMALLLIYFFAVRLRVLPASGWVSLTEDPIRNLRVVILPAFALALGQLAVFTRLLRSEMISTLQEEYIAMARAKGMPTWRILLVHALKPSSFPLVTVVGIQIGVLIGGAVIVETIFSVPGMGSMLYNAILSHDYIMVQGVTLFVAAAYVLANFLVDLVYAALDPRISRHAGA